ncbi:TPA: conjugal transfer protein [Streptococcus agalactiae]|nr:conjugal transfer protein [Streptococcus agalactiae]HEW6865881.1 conjugal transfer protein [Streptococcus pneumoniae]
MNKRKTVFIAVVIGAGIMAIIDRIRLHNKVEELEEKTEDIGRCHNDFYLMQQRYNKSIDEQIENIQEEIGSVYEHFEELSKGEEDGR